MDSIRNAYDSSDSSDSPASTSTPAQENGNKRKRGESLSGNNKMRKPEIDTTLKHRKRARSVSEENMPEDSDSKKKTYTDQQNQPGPSQESSVIQAREDPRKAVGLLTSYHGVVYQVHWMMIVALETKRLGNVPSKKRRAVNGFKFKQFEAEVEDAGKFDDVVWLYKDGDQEVYNFLQAKHSINTDKKVSIKELLKPKQKVTTESNETDNRPFALKKYFTSYRDEIKRNYQNGKNKQVENLIIVTNIDLDDTLKYIFEKPKEKISVLELSDFDTQNKGYEYWKLKYKDNKDKVIGRIVEDLEGSYDLTQLAKRLAKDVLDNNTISPSRDDFLNPYSKELEEKIFDGNKFRDNFVGGHDLSERIKNFREAFFKEGFLNEKKSIKTDCLINHPELLANTIAEKLKTFKINESSVLKINRRTQVIKNDIDKLAGYVLIKKNEVIQFNPTFLKASVKLPNDSIKTFKNSLYANLIKETADKLGEIKFHITKFNTCVEMLVDEISFWEGVKKFSKFRSRESFINEIIEPEPLAQQIALKLKGAVINIERKQPVIKNNIDKLAGYVLIETNGNIQFNPEFLTAREEELPNASIKIFRNKLKDKSTVDYLSKVKFEIKDFKTCKVTPSRDLPLYSLNDVKNDIEDFFDKLVFAVKYSKESLSNVIEHEFGTNVGLLDSDLVHAFRVKIARALDLTEKEFLSTDNDVEAFFIHVRQQIKRLALIGPTKEYCTQIEEFNINFKQDAVDNLELGAFLTSQSNAQIFNVIAEQNELSSIKVHQILKQMPEYQHSDSYIFSSLKSLFRIQDILEQALNSKSNNLLIIAECKSTEKEVENVYEMLKADLNKQLRNKPRNRIILISNRGDAIADKFKIDFSDVYKENFDKNNSIIDLTDDSQNKLLDTKTVIFQGKEVILGELICEKIKHLIDAEVLSKLINNKKIVIGKALQDLGDVKDYYINRTLSRQIKIKESFKETSKFFITHNSDFTESSLQQHQDIVLVSDYRIDFEKLCNNHKQHNIHWITEESNEFTWEQSHGNSLSKIREYVIPPSYHGQYEKEDSNSISDKVVIVAAEPGMGKSTILTNIAVNIQKSYHLLWIIRINLVDHSTWLKQKKKKCDEIEAIKFLYQTAGFQLFKGRFIKDDDKLCIENNGGKGVNLLEIEIFLNIYNQGKIFLLLDGFDEISPDYKENVIQLLKVLKDTNVKRVWVTTRPYGILSKLEDALNVFSYSLEPFSKADQHTFLKHFWENSLEGNVDNASSKIFIDELLDKFSASTNDEEGKFVSIPLQLKMIAAVFKGQFKNFCDSNEQTLSHNQKQNLIEKLNLANLYDEFFEIIFNDVYVKEKNPGTNADRDTVVTTRHINKIRQESIEKHKKLALYALFGEDAVNKLLPGQLKSKGKKKDTCIYGIIESIEHGNEKTGIIDRIVDNKPIFVHKTFAEYFAALFFVSQILSQQNKRRVVEFLTGHIYQEKNKVIRNFFDYMLAKDEQGENKYDIHVAVLNNNKNKVRNLIDNVNRTDKAGRTPLHLAAAYGYEEITKDLLDRLQTEPNLKSKEKHRKDKLLTWTPLKYADNNSYWNIAELLLQKGANGDDMIRAISTISNGDREETLLHIAAKKGYIEFTKVLVNNNADINAVGEYQRTPLHFAAQKDRVDVVKYFVDDKKVDVNIIDADHLTPLQLAVEKRSLNVVKYLVDVKKLDINNKHLLHLAAKAGSLNVVQYFVGNKNVDVNIKDEYGVAPMHWAAANGHLETVQYLVDNDAHLDITNRQGYTPLHFATASGYLNIVQYVWPSYELLMKKSEKDFTVVGDGSTLLHLAAKHGHLEIVKFLINEKHVKLNAVDNKGRTPLDIADRNCKLNVVKFLTDKKGLSGVK